MDLSEIRRHRRSLIDYATKGGLVFCVPVCRVGWGCCLGKFVIVNDVFLREENVYVGVCRNCFWGYCGNANTWC